MHTEYDLHLEMREGWKTGSTEELDKYTIVLYTSIVRQEDAG